MVNKMKKSWDSVKKAFSGNRKKWLLYGVLGVAALGLFWLGRTVYVVTQDPMLAFRTPRAQSAAPAATEPPAVTPEPTPAATIVDAATPAPTEQPTPTPYALPEDLNYMDNRVNILLLGYDKSPEREATESELYRDEDNDFRSDVIMLLSVDFAKKEAWLISVPRDSYAPIYNDKGELYSKRGRWKINAAFARGGSNTARGFQFSMQTVSKLLGVPIDYYAGVDMDGLKGVVDAMGGVYYDVDVEIRLNGRHLRTGYQKLSGQQVLDYCRARKGISTDVGRADRQQRILFTIFEQLKSRDQLRNFPEIYKSIKKYIRTNLNAEQIAAIAAFGVQLEMADLRRYTLEGEYNSNTPYSGANYYLIDNTLLKEKMYEVFGIHIATNPRYDLHYVLADIAGAEGEKDAGKAAYLIGHKKVSALGAAAGLVAAVEQRAAALLALSVRGEGASLDKSLDASAIHAAQNELYAAMGSLCEKAGITKKDVSSSRLPKAVYDALPESEAAEEQALEEEAA